MHVVMAIHAWKVTSIQHNRECIWLAYISYHSFDYYAHAFNTCYALRSDAHDVALLIVILKWPVVEVALVFNDPYLIKN